MKQSMSDFLISLVLNLEGKVVFKGGGMIGFLNLPIGFVLALGLVTTLISFYKLFSCELRLSSLL
jgi:hypothetical protein